MSSSRYHRLAVLSKPVELAVLDWIAPFAFEVIRDGNVQIAMVVLVREAGQGTRDHVILLDRNDVVEIKHGLFPVGVLCMGPGREPHRLWTAREEDVKVCNEGMDIICSLRLDGKLGSERKILLFAGLDVDVLKIPHPP